MRTLSILALAIFIAGNFFCLAADDSLTITTYYPSPFGVYKRLQTDTLGVGDNNSNGVLDSGDVPTTSGYAWIQGNVGIGTRSPAAKLDVYGDIMSDGSNMWMFHTPDDGRRTLYFGRGSNGSVAEWSIQFDAGGSASFNGNGSFYGNGYFGGNANIGGRVGIGTASTSPYPLQVVSPYVYRGRTTYQTWESLSGYQLAIDNYNSNYGIDWRFWQQNGGYWYPVLSVQGSRVGIATANPDPSYAVTITGNTFVQGGLAAYSFVYPSDLRLKEDISSINSPLARVLKLRGIEFSWKDKESPGKNFPEGRQIGVIAQEVEKQFPELISTDGQGYKSVDYARLSAVLIEAIKEQQKEIEALKLEVASLDRK